MGSLKAYSRPHKGTYLDSSYFSGKNIEYGRGSDGKPQGLFKAPQRHLFGFILLFGLSLAREASLDRLCLTSPPVKQKPDRKHQPAPTSRGAVCSSARKHSPWKFQPRT
ncbi:hypothetical protein ACFXTO_022091 [Malus domestica]